MLLDTMKSDRVLVESVKNQHKSKDKSPNINLLLNLFFFFLSQNAKCFVSVLNATQRYRVVRHKRHKD